MKALRRQSSISYNPTPRDRTGASVLSPKSAHASAGGRPGRSAGHRASVSVMEGAQVGDRPLTLVEKCVVELDRCSLYCTKLN
jgi:hypothetical protein